MSQARQGSPKARPAAQPERGGDTPSVAVRALLLAFVFVAACLPFLRAAGQGFVEWDDDYNFIKNPMWRGLSAQNVSWMFETTYMGHYQPLSWLSFGIEHELWGVSAERMHVVNIAIHALCAVLVLRLAARLIDWGRGGAPVPAGRESLAAWAGGVVAALAFAVHPLRVESVAWATERRDVLSTVFLLACVLSWLRTRDGENRVLWWVPTLAFYLLSLLSKAWGMTLPVVLLLMELYPLRTAEPTFKAVVKRAVGLWPFLPLAGWCAWKAAGAQESILAAVSWSEHPLINRIAQASWGSAFYLWKTLLPTSLSPLYELEEQFDPFARGYVVAMIVCAALTLALILLCKRFPAGLASWFAFLILVSPVLGLFQSGAQKAADRYTYIACLPFALLVGAGFAALARRHERGLRAPASLAAAGVLGVAFVALGAMTHAQTAIWKDSESLWRQVIAVEPESYIAHHNLAVTIGVKGQREEAIRLEQRSVELRPGKGNMDARHYLGTLYQQSGQPDKAFETWMEAFRVDPEHANTINSLVGELARRGERDRIFALFEEELKRDPNRSGVRAEYARRLVGAARGAEAEAQYRALLALDPRYVPAMVELGYLYEVAGRIAEAEPLLKQAVGLAPNNPDALAELGAVRAAQGRMQEASLLWGQALNLSPEHPRTNALVRQYSGAGR